MDHAVSLVFEMLSESPKSSAGVDTSLRVSVTDAQHNSSLESRHVLLQRLSGPCVQQLVQKLAAGFSDLLRLGGHVSADDGDESRCMCVLYDESDADKTRRGHDFGTIRDQEEEDRHHSLTESVHPDLQTLAHESDRDAGFAHDFGPQVFETTDEREFQVLESVHKVLQSPVCGTGQHQGPDPLQVLDAPFPVTRRVVQGLECVAEFLVQVFGGEDCNWRHLFEAFDE